MALSSARPRITVAAVIEKHGRFLIVEEEVDGRRVFNQPAGHLECGESLEQAVVRETREETGWKFVPEALIGLYLYRSAHNGVSYLRICFAGRGVDWDPLQALDEGVIRSLWMTRAELYAQRMRLRSPMVLGCIDDYLSGRSFSLDLLMNYGA